MKLVKRFIGWVSTENGRKASSFDILFFFTFLVNWNRFLAINCQNVLLQFAFCVLKFCKFIKKCDKPCLTHFFFSSILITTASYLRWQRFHISIYYSLTFSVTKLLIRMRRLDWQGRSPSEPSGTIVLAMTLFIKEFISWGNKDCYWHYIKLHVN